MTTSENQKLRDLREDMDALWEQYYPGSKPEADIRSTIASFMKNNINPVELINMALDASGYGFRGQLSFLEQIIRERHRLMLEEDEEIGEYSGQSLEEIFPQ
jgi:hypothetical protein